MEPRIKRRAEKACDGCRRKKIKCEVISEGFCTSCSNKNTSCTYNLITKRRGPAKGYVSVLEARLDRLEKILSKKATNKTEQQQQQQQQQQPKPKLLASNMTKTLDQETINHSCFKYEQTKSKLPATDSIKKLDLEMNKQGFFKHEHYISNHGIAWIFANTIREQSHHLGIQIHGNNDSCYYIKTKDETDHRPSQIKQMIEFGFIKPDHKIMSVNDWILAVANIDKVTSDRLLEVYFANIHPLVPVINKKAFLADYRGFSLSYPDAPLLNALYGAAACYVRNANLFGDWHVFPHGHIWDIPSNFSETMFRNLVKMIRSRYTPCLAYIQALVLSHYLSTSFDSWKDGWFLNCLAIRMSQDLGLHRLSKDWDIPEDEKETRRNVWWAVYVLDRWFSACTGKPMTAFDEDCDEIYPSENATLDEIMDKTTRTDTILPRFPTFTDAIEKKVIGDVIPLYQPFLQIIKLSEILGRILNSLYTPRAKKISSEYECSNIVKYLSNSLASWKESLPPLLQEPSQKNQCTHSAPVFSMSGVITISYFTLVILLHRPFIEKDLNSSQSSQQSLDICTDAATRIIEVAESMKSRDFLLVSWSFALYPVFTAILIHLYNCKNSNSDTANISKSNLVRGLATIDRLCFLSSTAKCISKIIRQLVTSSDIFKGDPAFCEMLQIEVTQAAALEKPAPVTPQVNISENEDFSWINQLYTPSPLEIKDPTFDQYFSMSHLNQSNALNTEAHNPNYFSLMADNSGDPSTLFRNRPSNPFWGVPSSMGIDDWQNFLKS